MKIAVIGCGYVCDHYMETLSNHPELILRGVTDREPGRAQVIADHYGTKTYASNAEVFADPHVEIVVNLTDPQSHFEVTRDALLAGKHVYSEKPLAMVYQDARALVELAASRNLTLSGAPCSVLSEAAQTLWKAVEDRAVGDVRLVYAELDDNPIYKMKPEGWSNERGIPWPYLNEYEVGCTLEHSGYYLTWLAAMFGPAETMTAFSACVAPDKTDVPLNPPDTPDFSVACIVFKSGVVARLTCSIVAPYDHRLKIIGNEGVLSVDECWHYGTPVHLERFTQASLNARKLRTIRGSSALQSVFGVGGDAVALATPPTPQLPKRVKEVLGRKRSPAGAAVKSVSKRELVNMDFFRGVAEMASAIREGREPLLSPAFVLHVNELAIAMQEAGRTGRTYRLESTFEPRRPLARTLATTQSYGPGEQARSLGRGVMERLIARAHKH
jgi:predicted dehydrogenase